MTDQTSSHKESSEPERSAGAEDSLPSYNSEVPAIPRKRTFTKEYKLKILRELESCKMPGGRGLIIRREGLFSSQVSQWKKAMGLSKKKTTSNSEKNELARLKRENARLKATIEKKDYIIEAQKKMNEIIENLAKTPKEPPLE
jgi:transposase-like protein